MTISAAYSNWASSYDTDRNLTRDLDQLVTRQTLTGQHPKTILELGCGTGKNTEFLVQIAEHVYALDFSEGMMAQARAKVPSERVTFTIADLTKTWPCADASIDLIVCNLVLEHIENLAFIFGEARRVLAPNGQFFLCELHPFKQYQGRKATFQRGEEQIEIAAFVHHLSDFLDAANGAGLNLVSLKEWWHEQDEALSPRLVSFLFE